MLDRSDVTAQSKAHAGHSASRIFVAQGRYGQLALP
jgi:hypothetical protein